MAAQGLSLWSADEAEWGLSQRAARILLAVPFIIAIVGVAAVPVRPLYRLLANEDGLAEWGQFISIALLILLYARIGYELWRRDHRWLGILYLAAMGAMIFIGGEEISWGQRIFGWATPAELEAVNNQGESNLHNVGSVLKVFNLVILGICAAAMVGPVLRWTVWRAKARSIAGYALIPPLAVIPFFGFEFAYRSIRLLFLPAPRYTLTKYSEFGELSFYLGLVVVAVLLLRVLRRRAAEAEEAAIDPLRPSFQG
jgi:hypothetical protein